MLLFFGLARPFEHLRGLTNQLLYLLSYASQIRQGQAITVPFEAGAILGKVWGECNRGGVVFVGIHSRVILAWLSIGVHHLQLVGYQVWGVNMEDGLG